jgi:enterochelin esterase family protein
LSADKSSASCKKPKKTSEPLVVKSPEIHPDQSVTLRLLAPHAEKVYVHGTFGEAPCLERDDAGVWSMTVGPLKPGLYTYTFDADDIYMPDPCNPSVMSASPPISKLEITNGQSAWDLRSVPHGEVHLHLYDSKSLGVQRRIHVYTPPGYQKGSDRYPILYLLHGWGGDDESWTSLGKANLIFDNLIAEGKAQPMVVVMPNGHTFNPYETNFNAARSRLTVDFERDLLEDVIPLAEDNYRVCLESGRAIVGLSMGGMHALEIGLGNIDIFSSIASFSAAPADWDRLQKTMSMDAADINKRLRLLWLACGKSDAFFPLNLEMIDVLKKKAINHIWHPTEGGHYWQIWRENLTELSPLLFR